VAARLQEELVAGLQLRDSFPGARFELRLGIKALLCRLVERLRQHAALAGLVAHRLQCQAESMRTRRGRCVCAHDKQEEQYSKVL